MSKIEEIALEIATCKADKVISFHRDHLQSLAELMEEKYRGTVEFFCFGSTVHASRVSKKPMKLKA